MSVPCRVDESGIGRSYGLRLAIDLRRVTHLQTSSASTGPCSSSGCPAAGPRCIYASFAAHRELAWFSQYQDRLPGVPALAAARQVAGPRQPGCGRAFRAGARAGGPAASACASRPPRRTASGSAAAASASSTTSCSARAPSARSSANACSRRSLAPRASRASRASRRRSTGPARDRVPDRPLFADRALRQRDPRTRAAWSTRCCGSRSGATRSQARLPGLERRADGRGHGGMEARGTHAGGARRSPVGSGPASWARGGHASSPRGGTSSFATRTSSPILTLPSTRHCSSSSELADSPERTPSSRTGSKASRPHDRLAEAARRRSDVAELERLLEEPIGRARLRALAKAARPARRPSPRRAAGFGHARTQGSQRVTLTA